MLPIECSKLGKRLPILLAICVLLRSNDVAERRDVHRCRPGEVVDIAIRHEIDVTRRSGRPVRPSTAPTDEDVVDAVTVEHFKCSRWLERGSGISRGGSSPAVDLVDVGDHLLWGVENSTVERDRDIVIGRRKRTCEELLLRPLSNDVTGHGFIVREQAILPPERSHIVHPATRPESFRTPCSTVVHVCTDWS